MVCGIYQIINTRNGKSYIGQSRNIQNRWRQHTAGLDHESALERGSYPLRKAFLKYGFKPAEIRTRNFKGGKVGAFEFKVIEECREEQLLERERFWIDRFNPEYNCNILTPPRQKKTSSSQSKFWVQYHNYDKLGYLPAETIIDGLIGLEDLPYEDVLSCVSTNKRAVLNAKGGTVFLIVGIGKDPKQYYLWSKVIIEEVEVADEEGELSYDVFGSGFVLEKPYRLESNDFKDFKKFCGNFGLGFTAIDNSPYLHELIKISEVNKPKKEQVNFSNYIQSFYSEVYFTNPREISALCKRGISRHLAVSLFPDDAIAILTGVYTVIVVFDPDDRVLNYKGSKLLIHTLNFPNEPELVSECKQILAQVSLDEDSFPEFSIQGWAMVRTVFQYDSEKFLADKQAHGWDCSLKELLELNGFSENTTCWGVLLESPAILQNPICDVVVDEILDGDLWSPGHEFQVAAFKEALEAPTISSIL